MALFGFLAFIPALGPMGDYPLGQDTLAGYAAFQEGLMKLQDGLLGAHCQAFGEDKDKFLSMVLPMCASGSEVPSLTAIALAGRNLAIQAGKEVLLFNPVGVLARLALPGFVGVDTLLNDLSSSSSDSASLASFLSMLARDGFHFATISPQGAIAGYDAIPLTLGGALYGGPLRAVSCARQQDDLPVTMIIPLSPHRTPYPWP